MLAAENIDMSDEYVIKDISVVCPECGTNFSTPCLVELPPISEDDIVEGDLHRVLPSADLRASLIAVCPHCSFASWTARFEITAVNPEVLPGPAELPPSKKFAVAVKCARAMGINPLDIAFIATNGLYCAREAGEDDQLWLELASYEQNRGMAPEYMVPDNAQDFLMMGELWRQSKMFEQAIQAYSRAYGDDFIPPELLNHLRGLAQARNHQPCVLPLHVVRRIYPEIKPGKNARSIPSQIVRVAPEPKLASVPNAPPPRRRAAAPAPVTIDSDLLAELPQLTEDELAEETFVELDPTLQGEPYVPGPDELEQFVEGQAEYSEEGYYDENGYFVAHSDENGQAEYTEEYAEDDVEQYDEEHANAAEYVGEEQYADEQYQQYGQYEEPAGETIGDMATAMSDEDSAAETEYQQPIEHEVARSEITADPVEEMVLVEQSLPAVQPQKSAPSTDPYERVRHMVAMPQGASSISLVQATTNIPAVPGTNLSVSSSAQTAEKRQNKSSGRLEAHLPPIQPPSEYLADATSPDASVQAHAVSQRAVRRAMKASQKEEDPSDKFPEIAITDEESGYTYTQTARQPAAPAKPQLTPQQIQQLQMQQMQQAQMQQMQQMQMQQMQQMQMQQMQQMQMQQAQMQQAQMAQTGAQDPSAQTATQAGGQDAGAPPKPKTTQEAIAQVESFLNLTRKPQYQNWVRSFTKK